jgi:hypothetical protein
MKTVWFLLCHSVTWGAYDTPGSSNQTDRYDIAEILSKMGVALQMCLLVEFVVESSKNFLDTIRPLSENI